MLVLWRKIGRVAGWFGFCLCRAVDWSRRFVGDWSEQGVEEAEEDFTAEESGLEAGFAHASWVGVPYLWLEELGE